MQRTSKCVSGGTANNSFKPNLLHYTKAMAEKACHSFGSTTQVGLTQALDFSSNDYGAPKMKAMAIATLLTALAVGPVFGASPPKDIGGLASQLQAERGVCASMAKDAKQAYSLAQYKAGLDRETAALKAEMDARVYGVGHGRQQSTEYFAQLLQKAAAEQRAKDEQTAAAFSSSGDKVAQCVVALKQSRKDAYVAFKQKHTKSPLRAQAEALMAAWLANVDEINTSTPDGGDASLAAWKAAKAQAEVSSL